MTSCVHGAASSSSSVSELVSFAETGFNVGTFNQNSEIARVPFPVFSVGISDQHVCPTFLQIGFGGGVNHEASWLVDAACRQPVALRH